MRQNYCKLCLGYRKVADPTGRWWQLWKTVVCPACGGDGQAKPPGWPDRAEMRRRRPPPPPPAPPMATAEESAPPNTQTIRMVEKTLQELAAAKAAANRKAPPTGSICPTCGIIRPPKARPITSYSDDDQNAAGLFATEPAFYDDVTPAEQPASGDDLGMGGESGGAGAEAAWSDPGASDCGSIDAGGPTPDDA